MQRYFTKDDNFNLYDSDKHHIKNVMRLHVGSTVELVNKGEVYLAKLNSLEDYTFDIIKKLPNASELDVELIMAISLVSEQKWDLIIQKLTELGVKTIIPLKTEHSIVRLDDKKVGKKLERWQMICKEASEQSKRTIIPKVLEPITLAELVQIKAPLKLVSSVGEKVNTISNQLQNLEKCARMIIVVGPEGGLSSKEEEYLSNNEFKKVSLGPRVMRVETASIYIASVVSFSCMR